MSAAARRRLGFASSLSCAFFAARVWGCELCLAGRECCSSDSSDWSGGECIAAAEAAEAPGAPKGIGAPEGMEGDEGGGRSYSTRKDGGEVSSQSAKAVAHSLGCGVWCIATLPTPCVIHS